MAPSEVPADRATPMAYEGEFPLAKAGWLTMSATALQRVPSRVVGLAVGFLLVAVQNVAAQLDPDGTGQTVGNGPATWDLAFAVDVPGLSGGFSPPIVLDGSIFVLTEYRVDPATFEEVEPALWRIDPATAEVTRFVEFVAPDRFATGFFTDGRNLIVARASTIEARSPHDGSVVWSTPIPALPDQKVVTAGCATPQLRLGMLFFGCTAAQLPRDTPDVVPPTFVPEVDIVMAIDAATGAISWSRVRDAEAMTGEDAGRGAAVGGGSRALVGVPTGIHDVVVSDDILVAAIVDRNPQPPVIQCTGAGASTSPPPLFQTVWAVDPSTGTHLWQWGIPSPMDPPGSVDAAETVVGQSETYSRVPPGIMLQSNHVVVKGEHLHLLNAKTGCVERTAEFGDQAETPLASNLLVADADTIVVARHTSIYGLNRASLQQKWEYRLSDDSPRPEQRALIVGSHVVVLTMTSEFNVVSDVPRLASVFNGRVTVLSLEDGSFQSTHDVRPFTFTSFMRSAGVGDGMLVVDGSDGPVLVLGTAAAGIQIDPQVSTVRPDVGNVLRLDLSASRAGVQDRSFDVRVDWGDGNATEWSPERVFEHTYLVRGIQNITVTAKNPAGQTATAIVALDVGWTQRPPTGFFETAFSPENQERTYFLLGLGVTFLLSIGGLIFPLSKTKAKIFGGRKEPKGPTRSAKRRK